MEAPKTKGDEIAAIEACANRAWPAAHVANLDGWQLRWSDGLTRRGNSAYPLTDRGAFPLTEKIARVEAWYRERGIGALYQLSPICQPAGLDAALGERGYAFESPVSIQTCAAAALATAPLRSPGLEARVESSASAEWRSISVDRGRFAERPGSFQGFLDRIGPRAGFAISRIDGEPVASGLGVADGSRVGVFAMLTVPEHRGSGAASALLVALARWATEQGASELYLQVERDNPPALGLYQSAGFGERYGYHYRRAPAR
jgi:ribosomal protein S18 acetylase RimI-like enzyme